MVHGSRERFGRSIQTISDRRVGSLGEQVVYDLGPATGSGHVQNRGTAAEVGVDVKASLDDSANGRQVTRCGGVLQLLAEFVLGALRVTR